MSARVINWDAEVASIGPAVVAIGVFDGVHIGHQALLRDTVDDARARGVAAVAVTFDRDPDQVVSPTKAACQLLTLGDKLAFIANTGVDAMLVVPFTSTLAEMSPEQFLDLVLMRSVMPLAVHVGGDFRFGRHAEGDVAALQRIGTRHGFEVRAHGLVSAGGSAVTSTRIRALVATGDVVGAAGLLGRPTRVTGTVHRGRGEGAQLGFPTANLVPVAFAALPADGVYAGRAIIAEGTMWAAAISVGTPPTFPDARDHLEAHLIGFDGDLYDQPLTLEFFERIRSQKTYPSLEALTSAISSDVNSALDIAGFPQEGPTRWVDENEAPFDDTLEDGSLVVTDPNALEAAEEAVAHGAPAYFDDIATGEWVAIMGSVEFFGSLGAGWQAFMVAAPLESAGIPFIWDPYPPEQRPTSLPGGGSYEQPFTLLVPQGDAEQARALMAAALDRTQAQRTNADTADDYIEDPEALEAAEQAVRAADRQPRALTPEPLDGWKTVARQMGYDRQRLGAIEYSLAAAGIAAEWKPFSPSEAPLLKLFALRETTFSLRVPELDADAARVLLAEIDRGQGESGS